MEKRFSFHRSTRYNLSKMDLDTLIAEIKESIKEYKTKIGIEPTKVIINFDELVEMGPGKANAIYDRTGLLTDDSRTCPKNGYIITIQPT